MKSFSQLVSEALQKYEPLVEKSELSVLRFETL